MKAYHFTNGKLRDGRTIPPIGETLVHYGPLLPCESGLHASEHPFDALTYAPGATLHRVLLSGEIIEHGDKLVARERAILATIDAEEMLWSFARWCALQIIDLWDPPQVVRDYLESGDENLRAASRVALRAASCEASGAASWAASRAASRVASREAHKAKFKEMVEEAFTA